MKRLKASYCRYCFTNYTASIIVLSFGASLEGTLLKYLFFPFFSFFLFLFSLFSYFPIFSFLFNFNLIKKNREHVFYHLYCVRFLAKKQTRTYTHTHTHTHSIKHAQTHSIPTSLLFQTKNFKMIKFIWCWSSICFSNLFF